VSDYPQLTAKLDEYLKWNKRAAGPLIESRARRLRYSLFKEFADIAPTKERIEAEVRAAVAKAGVKRPEGTTIEDEIKRRQKSRKYLASSFIFKGWKSAKDGQTGTFSQRSRGGRPTGRVIVNTRSNNPSVLIESLLAGAGIQNDQRRIVDRAVAGQIADMETYIVRKQQDQFLKTLKGLGPLNV
jgi:hypothetical protein